MILTHATPGVKSGPAQSQTEPNPHDIKRAVLASDLTSGQKAVLLAILDHAGHGRSSCWARNDTLSEETHLGIQHVSNTVQKLARDGWIIIHRATRFGPRMLFVGPRLPAECALHAAKVESRKRAKRNPLQPLTLYERCYNPSSSAAMSPVIAPLELETAPLTDPLTDPLKPLNVATNDNGFASLPETQTGEVQAETSPEITPEILADLEHRVSGAMGRVAQVMAQVQLAGLRNDRLEAPRVPAPAPTPAPVAQAVVELQTAAAVKAIGNPGAEPDMETRFRRLANQTMPAAVVEELAVAVVTRLDDAHSLAWHRRTYAQIRAIEDPARRMAAAVGCWKAYERSRTMPCRDRRRVYASGVKKVLPTESTGC